MNDLLEMMTYKRPAGSQTEFDFRQRFILCDPRAKMDKHRNIVIEVGEGSTTLFSAHTDTVHKGEGIQKVCADAAMGVAYKDDEDPLGADNAAGCWILLRLIEAGVPGVYIFHYGEEKGGIGSGDKAFHEEDFFKRFRRAVAFDRRGETDVITHQRWERCCSNTFANALAAALNAAVPGFDYAPDDTGIFTDTANYADLIPECTNVSVGYMFEHSKAETLDLVHIEKLLQAVLSIDWEQLPTERDPEEKQTSAYMEWLSKGSSLKGAANDDDGPSASDYARADDLIEQYQWDPRPIADYAVELENELQELERQMADLEDELAELRRWRSDMAEASKEKQRKKQRRSRDGQAGDGFAPRDPWEDEAAPGTGIGMGIG